MASLTGDHAAALRLLGVGPGASAVEISSAYRRQARGTHPDRCPEPDAAERFGRVTAAYRLALAAAPPISQDPVATPHGATPPTPPAPWMGPAPAGPRESLRRRGVPLVPGPARVIAWPTPAAPPSRKRR